MMNQGFVYQENDVKLRGDCSVSEKHANLSQRDKSESTVIVIVDL